MGRRRRWRASSSCLRSSPWLVVGASRSAGGDVGHVRGALDPALGVEVSEGQFRVVARTAHGDHESFAVDPDLQRLLDELLVPMVYVSHAADEVRRIADRVIELDSGRVMATQVE